MDKIPEPIQWDQGMLLTPKHFLELAGRYETLQQNMTAIQKPFNWGVLRFEYDKSRLGAGTVAITELEAVMPDGTLVSATDADIEPLALDKTATGIQEVHLAIPAQRSFAWGGPQDRYRPVKTAGGALPRLRPILHLAATLPPPRFVSMPLLRLKYDTEFVNSFEPPWMLVPAASELTKICAAVAARIRSKMSFVIATIDSGQTLSGLPVLRDKLRNLASGLPVLEGLLHARDGGGDGGDTLCDPFSLYLALCSVAGHVGLMSREMAAPDLQSGYYRYNHRDLLLCFTAVAEFIDAAIDYGVSEAWKPYPFRAEGEKEFRLDLKTIEGMAEVLAAGARWPSLAIGLRVGPGQDRHRIQQWGERCLIATGDVAPKIANRVLGAPREIWPEPQDLAPPPGVLLFAIGREHQLDTGQELHLLGDAPLPAEAWLYVRRTQENKG